MPVHERVWNAVGDASISRHGDYMHNYLNRLYFPTHARFGPMFLGALLAFLLPSGSEKAAAAGAGAGAGAGAAAAAAAGGQVVAVPVARPSKYCPPRHRHAV